MPHNLNIEKILDATPRLWKGRWHSRGQRVLPTGLARLDARLPGGGWPLGAVCEVIAGAAGLGEFSLLLPALADIGKQGRWVVLVNPPWVPCPASLHGHGLLLERLLLIRTNTEKEALWACEQALANGQGGAVLAWPERIAFPRLRRLQLAAETGDKLAFLFRPADALPEASPAALRLLLESNGGDRVQLSIIKCRGGRPPETLWLARSRDTAAQPGIRSAGPDPFPSRVQVRAGKRDSSLVLPTASSMPPASNAIN